MELRHLRYFVATAQLLNFRRAAQQLGIVQPALSKQIAQLEEEVGAPLFHRLGRGVTLTAAGESLLGEAQRLLADAGAAVQRAGRVAAGRSGRLRLGYVDTTLYQPRVPTIIQGYRRAAPEVDLELVQGTSAELVARLGHGEIDFGFVFHLPALAIPSLRSRRIATERIKLIAAARHPLVRRKGVRLGDVRGEPIVFIPRALSPVYHDAISAACLKAGFTPNIVQEAQTDAAILSLVAMGLGVSFCTESTALRAPQGTRVVDLPDLNVAFGLHALWRGDNQNPALPALIALVKE